MFAELLLILHEQPKPSTEIHAGGPGENCPCPSDRVGLTADSDCEQRRDCACSVQYLMDVHSEDAVAPP